MAKILAFVFFLFFLSSPASAYELDHADHRVPLPTRDWKFFQQQCDAFPDADVQIACAYEGWDEFTDDYGNSYPGEAGQVQEPKGMGAGTYWHETGHLFDFTVLTDSQRLEFLRLVGRSGEPWWTELPDDPQNIGPNYDPPGEWFAEAYSICAMRATGRLRYGVNNDVLLPNGTWRPISVRGYGYPYHATWRRHMRICQLIWNARGMHYTFKEKLNQN